MKTFEGSKNRVLEISKMTENQNITFIVICTNYIDKNIYYLKNGKFSCAKNCFNTQHSFLNSPRKLSNLHRDGIYKITELQKGERNIYNII
jgi:hypothetical protein